jgi:hypothetical protein
MRKLPALQFQAAEPIGNPNPAASIAGMSVDVELACRSLYLRQNG